MKTPLSTLGPEKAGISDQLLKYLPSISMLLLLIGLLAFNHVLEIRAAEGRRALITIEMLQHDNLLVPYLHGYPYYNKPPLYNWLIALFFGLFGSTSEAVLRLPGVLSLIATAALLYRAGKNYVGQQTAMLGTAAFVTITDLLFFGSINAGEIDLFYSLVTMLQVFSIFYFFQKGHWTALFAVSYALTAVGFLTKGMPSLAFQALTLLVYFLYQRKFMRLLSWQHALGIVVLIIPLAAYFLAYSTQSDADALKYLVNTFKQASQRTANEYGMADLLIQVLRFPFDFLQKLLPWSLCLVFLFSKAVRQSLMKNPFIAFCVIFVLANIPIYWTAPELRIRDTYMFFPVLAMIFVYMLEKGITFQQNWNRWLSRVVLVAIGIAGLALTLSPLFGLPLEAAEKFILAISGITLLAITVFARQKQWSLQHYWWLVLALAVCRLTYNLVGMPYTTRTATSYRTLTTGMLKTTGDKPLHYYGKPMVLQSNVSFLGKDLYVAPTEMPVEYATGFAFYDALYRGEVMALETEVKPGEFYVLYDYDHNDRLIVLDTLHKMMGGRTMYFCEGR